MTGPDPTLLYQALWIPCKTQQQLHDWIRLYLGLDLPDGRVDPDSTSSPMEYIWEIYSKALANDDARFNRVLTYSSRDSIKTLGTAVLEVLGIFHLNRNSIHLAAIEDQSRKAQAYVKSFLEMPILRDFKVGDNVTSVLVVYYLDKATGERLTLKAWKALPEQQRQSYLKVARSIQITTCTLQAVNGPHESFMCVDGDTRIRISVPESQRRPDSRGSVRQRVSSTARSIFRRLSGASPGGRPGGETESVVSSPAVKLDFLSFNTDTGRLEFRPVTYACRRRSPVVRITTVSGRTLTCTRDHPLSVLGRGFVEAGEIAVAERLVFVNRGQVGTPITNGRPVMDVGAPVAPQALTSGSRWEQVLLGSLLGDGSICKKPQNNPYFYENHCQEQTRYLAWKEEVLREKLRTRPNLGVKSGYTGRPEVGFSTGCSPLLLPYCNFRKTLEGVERLGALGLAVWFMDDGCQSRSSLVFSTECFSLEQNQKLAAVLESNFGIKVSVREYSHGDRDDRVYCHLVGDMEAKRRLVEICLPYVHPDLAYKFDLSGNKRSCRFCGRDVWFYANGTAVKTCNSSICLAMNDETLGSEVVASVEPLGETWVYDFTVEGNNNFVANGFLVKNCVDEVDVVPKARIQAYHQAKAIPAVSPDGYLPITLLTSTRKFSFGLVQKEINDSAASGLHIRHWNILDVTQACPTERHRPDLPRLPIYVDDAGLKAIGQKEYEALAPEDREKYVKNTGYSGCLSNCKIFSACKGRLATEQKCKSKMLKPIEHVTNLFRSLPLDMAQAELLCRKASLQGLIYPRLERGTHVLTAAQIYERLVGEHAPAAFGKDELAEFAKSRGMDFFTGMDFGFTHKFSTVTGFRDGNRFFIIDCQAKTELEPDQQVELCDRTIKRWDPVIFPDMSSPQMIRVFRRSRYRMRHWTKGPDSVVGGINVVRLKLSPALSEPELFFLAGDIGVDYLFNQMAAYHWALEIDGTFSKEPDKVDDDSVDAARYCLMNVFPFRGRVTTDPRANEAPMQPPPTSMDSRYPQDNWMGKIIQEHVHGANPTLTEDEVTEHSPDNAKGRAGGFSWEF